MSAVTAVGFIGLGIMGSRQAANLARAGFELTVFNRTHERAEEWAGEHGGHVAGTPREVAERTETVITMVVDGAQVEAMLLGEDGAVHGARPGTLFVDMSTIGPADARRIGGALVEQGHRFVDAPVTGSAPKAQDGTLTIMAGGAEDDVRRAMPLFEAMGELIVHVGELGMGQQVKVISNAVAATNCVTLAQGLVVGRRTGVDLEALLKIMGAGAADSTMLQLKGAPMLAHDFSPLFRLEHMLKDVGICLSESEAAGVPFPAADAARDLYAAAMERGLCLVCDEGLPRALKGCSGRGLGCPRSE
jgi:3-hydroxyisobutyrate dehydrogenase-like beta-hydroxyacid dehydrogenase